MSIRWKSTQLAVQDVTRSGGSCILELNLGVFDEREDQPIEHAVVHLARLLALHSIV